MDTWNFFNFWHEVTAIIKIDLIDCFGKNFVWWFLAQNGPKISFFKFIGKLTQRKSFMEKVLWKIDAYISFGIGLSQHKWLKLT